MFKAPYITIGNACNANNGKIRSRYVTLRNVGLRWPENANGR